MSKKRSDDAETLANTFAALGTPTRLRLLRELRDLPNGRRAPGELCVEEMVRRLDVQQPAVSHHLGVLRVQGLVLCRREGKRRFYRLRPGGFLAAASFLASLVGKRARWPKGARR